MTETERLAKVRTWRADVTKYEGCLHVLVSGLDTEEQASEMNERLNAVLMAVYEMPGFTGDMVVGAEIKAYDPDTGDEEEPV